MRARPKQKAKERESSPLVLFLLLVGGTMMYAALTGPDSHQTDQSSVRVGSGRPGYTPSSAFQQKVEYYKNETGVRMNQERIRAEYENSQTAPLAVGGPILRAQDPSGPLKFEGERNIRDGVSDQGKAPAYIGHPDVGVQATLSEQQELQEWEQRARAQYVQEFINNARAAGIRVKVDKNYNVEVLRSPQSMPDSSRPEAAGETIGPVPFTQQAKDPGAAQ